MLLCGTGSGYWGQQRTETALKGESETELCGTGTGYFRQQKGCDNSERDRAKRYKLGLVLVY